MSDYFLALRRAEEKAGEALQVVQKLRRALTGCVACGVASEASRDVMEALEAAWALEARIALPSRKDC